MTVPYIFATHAAGAVPASELDADFAYVLQQGGAVATVAALRLLAFSAADMPATMVTLGYLAANDGGGGPRWIWNAASTATDDGFKTVKVTAIATGRFIRDLADHLPVSPKWGGCGLGVADDTTQFQKIVDAGYPIDMSGCTVPLGAAGNAIVVGANDSPMIFSDGSGTFTPSAAVGTATMLFNVTRNDFTMHKIFFNLTIGGSGGTGPGPARAIYATNLNRFRCTECWFSGGGTSVTVDVAAVSAQYIWIDKNLFTDNWSSPVTSNVPTNIFITDNVFRDCVKNIAGNSGGVIRIGALTVAILGQNCIISRNQIIDCSIGQAQEAIDVSCGAYRNVMCDNNLIYNTGSGGFECKTQCVVGVPDDVLYNWRFTDNLVVMSSVTASIGFAMNNGAGCDAPEAKAQHVVISNNTIMCETLNASSNGINLGGWLDVELSYNHIYNLGNGIVVNADGNTTDTAEPVTMIGNVINVSNHAIGFDNRIANQVTLLANRGVAAAEALYLGGAVITGLISKGNYWETTAAAGYAAIVRDVHDAIFDGDTFIGTAGGVDMIGVAPTNTRFVRCDVNGGTLDAFTLSLSGTDNVIENCTYTVPVDKRLYTLGGGQSITAYNNTRTGRYTGDPTGTLAAAASGEMVYIATPTSGGFLGYIGTTAGVPSAAAWKGFGAIA